MTRQTNVNAPAFNCPVVNEDLNEEEEEERGMPKVLCNKIDDGYNYKVPFKHYIKAIVADRMKEYNNDDVSNIYAIHKWKI